MRSEPEAAGLRSLASSTSVNPLEVLVVVSPHDARANGGSRDYDGQLSYGLGFGGSEMACVAITRPVLVRPTNRAGLRSRTR